MKLVKTNLAVVALVVFLMGSCTYKTCPTYAIQKESPEKVTLHASIPAKQLR